MEKLYSYQQVQDKGLVLKDPEELTSVKFDFALSNFGKIENGTLIIGSDVFPLIEGKAQEKKTDDSELAKHLNDIKPGAYKEKQALHGNPFFDTLVGGMWYDQFH